MNRYILVRRLMGPSILLLLGIVALLSQAHVVHFYLFFPLLLILIGVLKLVERAVFTTEDGYPPPPQSWGSYPGGPQPPGPIRQPPNSTASSGTSNMPPPVHDFSDRNSGGES